MVREKSEKGRSAASELEGVLLTKDKLDLVRAQFRAQIDLETAGSIYNECLEPLIRITCKVLSSYALPIHILTFTPKTGCVLILYKFKIRFQAYKLTEITIFCCV